MDERENKKRFAVLMNWLAEKFPLDKAPRKMSKADLADYYEAVEDVRVERLEWGAKHWYANEIFFPRPVELRRAAYLAPSSVLPPVPQPKQLEDLTPPEVSLQRIRDIIDSLKGKFYVVR